MSRAQKAFLTAAFCLICFVAGVKKPPSAYAQSKRERSGDVTAAHRAAQAIIALTNRERMQRNLLPLKMDGACTLAITGHVKDMARARYLSHQGRDGRGASDRYRQYKPTGRGAGENIAYNTHGTGESFMRQWLRSPGHRGNILSPVYKGIGVSVQATCSARQAGGRCYYYAGQCFSL
ncbi:MAG: CAP domain-containing protein [Hyphomicrobiaceae bacterium]